MYRPAPDEKELAAFGLTLDDYSDQMQVEVWPDSLPAFEVMEAMRSQWSAGMNGPTGLRYEALGTIWPLVGVRKKDRPRVFQDLRVMEFAALRVMREAS